MSLRASFWKGVFIVSAVSAISESPAAQLSEISRGRLEGYLEAAATSPLSASRAADGDLTADIPLPETIRGGRFTFPATLTEIIELRSSLPGCGARVWGARGVTSQGKRIAITPVPGGAEPSLPLNPAESPEWGKRYPRRGFYRLERPAEISALEMVAEVSQLPRNRRAADCRITLRLSPSIALADSCDTPDLNGLGAFLLSRTAPAPESCAWFRSRFAGARTLYRAAQIPERYSLYIPRLKCKLMKVSPSERPELHSPVAFEGRMHPQDQEEGSILFFPLGPPFFFDRSGGLAGWHGFKPFSQTGMTSLRKRMGIHDLRVATVMRLTSRDELVFERVDAIGDSQLVTVPSIATQGWYGAFEYGICAPPPR